MLLEIENGVYVDPQAVSGVTVTADKQVTVLVPGHKLEVAEENPKTLVEKINNELIANQKETCSLGK